jgi:hypothetical protein
MLNLIARLLNVNAYNYLRTELQIGYEIEVGVFTLNNVDGFYVALESFK